MRGMVAHFSWKEKQGAFKGLSDWLACEVMDELPDTKMVRVSMQQLRLPPPEVFREQGWFDAHKSYWHETRAWAFCARDTEGPATEGSLP